MESFKVGQKMKGKPVFFPILELAKLFSHIFGVLDGL